MYKSVNILFVDINTFASQRLVFDEKNESFDTWGLTHVLNLMHFQGEMLCFFLKNKALRSESVKQILFCFLTDFILKSLIAFYLDFLNGLNLKFYISILFLIFSIELVFK